MTTTTQPATIAGLVELVEKGLAAVLPEGAITPADGPQTCGECQGAGSVQRSYTPEPVTCYSCWWGDRTTKRGSGIIQPPSLEAILRGLYTDQGGSLRRRKSYLSPAKVEEFAGNRETSEIYTYVRANLEFDLGRNVNLGGLIMNELKNSNPWKPWADAVNAVLLALHGRARSEGAARWAQAMGWG